MKEACGCPGSKMQDFAEEQKGAKDESGSRSSQLRQWPIQLHLVSPEAPYFQKADVVISADCVAYAAGDFHKDYLKGKSLVIACPKLDEDQDTYVEKITSLIDAAKVNTITVLTMEVPCCAGLVNLTTKALHAAKRKVPVKSIVIGIRGGGVLSEDWIS